MKNIKNFSISTFSCLDIMCSRQNVFILFLMLSLYNLSAQNTLTKANNQPRVGDALQTAQVTYAEEGLDGENIIWDFSKVAVINKKHIVTYFNGSDSSTVKLEDNTMSKLSFSKDSVALAEDENPLTKIVYANPVVQMHYPMHYQDVVRGVFTGNGIYCNHFLIHEKGKSEVSADAYGTIILSEKDTLRNTLRVKMLRTSQVMIKRESLSKDSIMVEKNNKIFQWFARGYRYPVYETRISDIYKDSILVDHHESAYRYLPSEQRILHDALNESVAYNDSVRQSAEESNIAYQCNVTDSRLTVDYSLKSDAHVSFILSSSMGVVYEKQTRDDREGENYEVSFNLAALQHGQYVLYIIVNNQKYVEKFNVN